MNKKLATVSDEITPANADVNALMQRYAGYGVSNRSEDNLIPQISYLQSQSPEVVDGPAQVPGAKAGDFLLGDVLVKGTEGFWCQPCLDRDRECEHTWLEFTPLDRGGGFVAQHDFTGFEGGTAVPPPGAISVGKQRWRFENGNELVHYRQWPVIVWKGGIGLEYVMSFKSTGHTVARRWNTEIGRVTRQADGSQVACFSHIYHVVSEHHRNPSGQWYLPAVPRNCIALMKKNGGGNWQVNPDAERIVGDPVRAINMGASLSEAFRKREKQAAQETVAVDEGVM